MRYLIHTDAVPYADFALWGPFGKRLAIKMIYTMIYIAFVAMPDGTWQRREMPVGVIKRSQYTT